MYQENCKLPKPRMAIPGYTKDETKIRQNEVLKRFKYVYPKSAGFPDKPIAPPSQYYLQGY